MSERNGPTICAVEGCGRATEARGWCSKHYLRWRKHGDPLVTHGADRELPVHLRVLARVNFGGPCWEYEGSLDQKGYGWISWRESGRSFTRRAHRVVYEGLVRPLDEGETLDHLCRNRACVDPDHLEPVTVGENVLRGYSPPALNARRTHCVNGHELTPDNVYRRPSRPEHRSCRTCHRLARRKARRRASQRRAAA